MKNSAPAFTTSDTIFATCASPLPETFGLTYSFQMLRVNKLAQAIDMIAAGTSAPIAIAANATPTNQSGNACTNSAGTAYWLPNALNPSANCGIDFTPAATAMVPRSAISPSAKEYAGRITAFL